MAFVYKTVTKEDADYEKYNQLEQRYIDETPLIIMNKHNYLYNYIEKYYEYLSLGIRSVNVISDDKREIYLLLIHFEDCRLEYETPMAWVLFLQDQMILMNCDFDNDIGLLDNGQRWLKNRYLVEPLLLPDCIQITEEKIKQYIVEALIVFSEGGGRKLMYTSISTEVIFDQVYQFKGYNN